MNQTTTRAPFWKYANRSSQTRSKILYFYQANLSLREIARRLEIPKARVRYVLMEAGCYGPHVAATTLWDPDQTRLESLQSVLQQLLRELCDRFDQPRTILLDNAPVGLAVPELEADVEPPSTPDRPCCPSSDPAPSTR